MGKTNVRMLVIASVFTAMILLTVMFPFLRILNEYAHIGDGVIYLACVILPAPYAILAASAGAAFCPDEHPARRRAEAKSAIR